MQAKEEVGCRDRGCPWGTCGASAVTPALSQEPGPSFPTHLRLSSVVGRCGSRGPPATALALGCDSPRSVRGWRGVCGAAPCRDSSAASLSRPSNRSYMVPDPPGLFDGHVWPMYQKYKREMEQDGVEVGKPGSCPSLTPLSCGSLGSEECTACLTCGPALTQVFSGSSLFRWHEVPRGTLQAGSGGCSKQAAEPVLATADIIWCEAQAGLGAVVFPLGGTCTQDGVSPTRSHCSNSPLN